MSYERILKELESLKRKVERLSAMDAPQAFNPAVLDDYLLEADAALLYLGKNAKANDSDKLDGLDSIAFLGVNDTAQDSNKLGGVAASGYVNTTSAQTINGVKTFGSLPTLPTATPTTNQPTRRGYADATYQKIPTWQAWTPSVTGWSTSGLTRVCRYLRMGKIVFFQIYVYGQSNSDQAYVDLPSGLPAVDISNLYFDGAGTCADNGVEQTTPMRWLILPGATNIKCYMDFTATTLWQTSGVKVVIAQGFYETSAT